MPITAWIISLLAILLAPILLIQFSKRCAAAFNLAITNRNTSRAPGFGILTHGARKSRKGLPHTASRLLSFGTCGCLAPVERVFHFTQEFRRKKRFFQDVCARLDQFTQSRKLVTKAGYKQKLHLGASRTNSLCEINAVESGQDNITDHKVYGAILFLAQAECFCTFGGRKDRKPVAFERPVQNVSKIVVVLDYQDGDGRLAARRAVKLPARQMSFSC